MGEAEEDRGGDPAGGVAVGGAREKILQQAAEEKFFWPGGKKKDGDGEREEGFPFVDVRGVNEEVDFQAKRNDDAGDEDERAEDVEGPVGAPGDVVADAFAAAEEEKSCDGDVDGEHNGKDVSEPSAGVRPKPLRGAEFYGDPDSDEDEKVLPRAGCGGFCGGEKRQGKKDECGYGTESSEGCDAGAEGVNQINKKDNYAQEPAGGRSGDGGDAIGEIARGEEQHSRKKKRESHNGGDEGAAVGGAV